MKNIIFPISALALIILAFTNRKTIIQPDETPKLDLTLEPVGTKNIDETPILEKYIQNGLKDPESKLPGAIIGGVSGAIIGGVAGGLNAAYIILQEEGDMRTTEPKTSIFFEDE
jgi:hypothetical protein